MRYEEFELYDFLQDEEFVEWIKHPTPQTDYFWRLWLEKHPEKKPIVGLAKEFILNVNLKNQYLPSSNDTVDVLENINKNRKSGRSSKSGYLAPIRLSYRYAAVILFLFVAGGLYQFRTSWLKSEPSEEQVISQSNIFSRNVEKGEKLSLVLPDGTKAKLNAGTKLTFHENPELHTRVAVLDGEAFFDVAHDKSKPFIIRTDRVETTVIGTSFNIKAYPESEFITVAVVSGKVKVESNNGERLIDSNTLEPEEMYTFNKENQQVTKSRVSIDEIIAWKDDIIMFTDASFEEIKSTLERWYGVEFVVEEGIRVKEDFSGQYKNPSLERILESLSFTSRFEYVLENKKVFVRNK